MEYTNEKVKYRFSIRAVVVLLEYAFKKYFY